MCPFLQASQVITVNENLPLTSVEPEVITQRRTVKICCCIPKGDVLLNAWYVNILSAKYFGVYTYDVSINMSKTTVCLKSYIKGP